MPKGYWIAAGQFLKGIEKLLVNARIILIPAGQMFVLASAIKKSGNEVNRRQSRNAQQLSAKTTSIPFS